MSLVSIRFLWLHLISFQIYGIRARTVLPVLSLCNGKFHLHLGRNYSRTHLESYRFNWTHSRYCCRSQVYVHGSRLGKFRWWAYLKTYLERIWLILTYIYPEVVFAPSSSKPVFQQPNWVVGIILKDRAIWGSASRNSGQWSRKWCEYRENHRCHPVSTCPFQDGTKTSWCSSRPLCSCFAFADQRPWSSVSSDRTLPAEQWCPRWRMFRSLFQEWWRWSEHQLRTPCWLANHNDPKSFQNSKLGRMEAVMCSRKGLPCSRVIHQDNFVLSNHRCCSCSNWNNRTGEIWTSSPDTWPWRSAEVFAPPRRFQSVELHSHVPKFQLIGFFTKMSSVSWTRGPLR